MRIIRIIGIMRILNTLWLVILEKVCDDPFQENMNFAIVVSVVDNKILFHNMTIGYRYLYSHFDDFVWSKRIAYAFVTYKILRMMNSNELL